MSHFRLLPRFIVIEPFNCVNRYLQLTKICIETSEQKKTLEKERERKKSDGFLERIFRTHFNQQLEHVFYGCDAKPFKDYCHTTNKPGCFNNGNSNANTNNNHFLYNASESETVPVKQEKMLQRVAKVVFFKWVAFHFKHLPAILLLYIHVAVHDTWHLTLGPIQMKLAYQIC